jgi:hypothetical protein
MWKTVLILAAAALTLGFAPAPSVDLSSKGSAETILAAGTSERMTIALRYLRSKWFLNDVLRDRKVRKLGSLKGVKNRRAWLAARLKVEAKAAGSLVVVRLNDCRLGDGLVILRAAIDRVAKKPLDAKRPAVLAGNIPLERRMIERMRARMILRGALDRQERIDRIEAQVDAAELAVQPLRVKRAPARAIR